MSDSFSHFDAAYEGTPPWDIGRPQPVFVHLAKSGAISGSVLDVGCGTGENSLFLADQGHEVWGIDFAQKAVQKAKAKAKKRGINVSFLQHNALELASLKRQFDSAIDSGLFHTFSDEERPVFASSLVAALRSKGTYFMMCMSDKEPSFWGGPRRVTRQEIRETFRKGWKINYIREERFATNMHDDGAIAWLSSITRL